VLRLDGGGETGSSFTRPYALLGCDELISIALGQYLQEFGIRLLFLSYFIHFNPKTIEKGRLLLFWSTVRMQAGNAKQSV
jgi:hypothetical protein